ncbi:MAG: nucleoside deaminase [Desulfobulbaceae bacterium]
MSAEDEKFMREAVRLAEEGMRSGRGGPFGAVIVLDGEIIGRGCNRVLETNDPTAHAEIVAIREACRYTDNYWLEGSRIYTTCEPCPMCLAAVYWARIDTLVYGADRNDAAALEFDDALIYREVCAPFPERSLASRQCLRERSLEVMRLWPQFDLKRIY